MPTQPVPKELTQAGHPCIGETAFARGEQRGRIKSWHVPHRVWFIVGIFPIVGHTHAVFRLAETNK